MANSKLLSSVEVLNRMMKGDYPVNSGSGKRARFSDGAIASFATMNELSDKNLIQLRPFDAGVWRPISCMHCGRTMMKHADSDKCMNLKEQKQ